jgi:hypothetical protein
MRSIRGVFLVAFLSAVRLASALSNITFYSDTKCTDVLGIKAGPDDGTCTPFPDEVLSFRSFRVTSLDQTCAGMLPLRFERRPFSSVMWKVKN